MSDPTALAGLRRLVLHARDQLAATTPQLREQQNLIGRDAEAYAAQVLACEVLTLVADCLPAEDETGGAP